MTFLALLVAIAFSLAWAFLYFNTRHTDDLMAGFLVWAFATVAAIFWIAYLSLIVEHGRLW